ncbi:hypothetical protein AWENTII_011230 [Aspergillus wentii]|nr:hypothetical protein MW887_008429 [Aspergillus wentii]
MKITLSALVLGLLPLALGKSIIVTYPKDTPQDVYENEKKSFEKAGGHITHEYQLFKGFSADAPADAIRVFSTQTKYKPCIEEEQVVTAVGGSH